MLSRPISIYFTLTFLFCFFIFISCTSVPNYVGTHSSPATPTILPLPSASELLMNRMDPLVQADLEMGTPISIHRAVVRLYAAGQSFSREKLFQLTLATYLMRLLYPFEIIDWSIPHYKYNDPYLDALLQIEKDICPLNLGADTFLGAVIPAIILVKESGIREYAGTLEKRLLIARDFNPLSILPLYLLGLLYEKLGKLSDAEDYYQMVWLKDESCYPAGIRFAYLAILSGNYEQAYNIAERLYAYYPDVIPVQLLFAQTCLAKDNLVKAEEILSIVRRKAKNNTASFFLFVKLCIKKREFLTAETLLDEFYRQNKMDKNYFLLRAEIFLEWSKNIVKAKHCLEKAQTLYPHEPDVILACAHFCVETKNTINEQSADYFIALLLEQHPRNSIAIRLLVNIDIEKKQWDRAFERAQYLYKHNPIEENLILYTRVCVGMKNWTEAMKTVGILYNDAHKQPSDEIIKLYLQALYGANEYNLLEAVINQRLSNARSALKSVLLYYQALIKSSDKEKLGFLRLSLLSDPRSSVTLFALYEWYFRNKDYRTAYYYLQQVLVIDPHNETYLRLMKNLEKFL